MKKKIGWPQASRDIVVWIVLGWIVGSMASCTARSIEARAEVFKVNTGTVVW